MSGNNGGGGGGVGNIPAGSKKMVESLKEIVSNYSDSEIYAVLKEVNMDPNEAVNRLLSQDPFHEVKSKREKRKEGKDPTESRSRGGTSSSRGGRVGTDRHVGRGVSESTPHGKFTPVPKKENGSSTTLATGTAGSSINWQPPSTSVVASDNKKPVPVAMDPFSSAPHPSAVHQPAWGGVPGQVSMADIVKMGRAQNKAQTTTNANLNHNRGQGPSYHAPHNFQFSNDQASEVHLDPGAFSAKQDSINDEWPLIEPTASLPSFSEPTVVPQPHPDSSNLGFDRINEHLQVDEVQETEDHGISAGHVPSDSIPNRMLQEDDFGGEPLYDNDIDIYRHQDHNHSFKHREVEDVNASISSAAEDMQQLTIQTDQDVTPEGEVSSVVIPDHLQVQSAECSHLSFGTFGPRILSGPSASAAVKSHAEEVPNDEEDRSMGHLTTRNSELFASQPDRSEVTHDNQYNFPSSDSDYKYEDAQQLNVEFSQPLTSSQAQNLASFNAMGYSNALPSNLLAANAQSLRESDISYSMFPSTKAMSTNYGNLVSPVGSPSISMPEALKNVGLSSAQPTQQNHNGAGVATGPSLPQQLNLHPYASPAVPMAPFGYPFLPQSYPYMASTAFQQAFGGSSAYHQSIASIFPHLKNSVSGSNLPQSASVASGYGAFGNTTAIPSNFQLNASSTTPVASFCYDDSPPISQYKDNSHLMSLQQSENSASWHHGQGSRTMSGLPGSTYYNYQGQHQQQQPGGFRQAQQPSQNYGSLGYPNFYSHSGISLDHQQQNPRDNSSLTGAQGQSKPSQQLWQNNY